MPSLTKADLHWKGRISMIHAFDFHETGLRPVNTSLSLLRDGDTLLARVSKIEKLDQDDANTYVRLDGVDFHNGIIEVDVCGKLLPDAPAHARGFIGIVFRANPMDSEFESFYIRPTNGRDCTDPVRKNHACQYFSFPGYTFGYFREFGIGGYEAAVEDIALGEWSHIKAEIVDDTGVFSVNGREVLRINDLKHGAAARGTVGLYVDIGTDGFFKNLAINCFD